MVDSWERRARWLERIDDLIAAIGALSLVAALVEGARDGRARVGIVRALVAPGGAAFAALVAGLAVGLLLRARQRKRGAL